MKYLSILFIQLLLLSCDPSTTTVTVPPDSGSISYKIDSTTYSWSTGSYGFLGSNDTCETLTYSQTDPASASRGITIQIVTDTLKTRRYCDTSAKSCLGKVVFMMVEHNNITLGSFYQNGKTWVEFTSITDTTVSGTFAAQVHTSGGSQVLNVTDGVFSNVRINRN